MQPMKPLYHVRERGSRESKGAIATGVCRADRRTHAWWRIARLQAGSCRELRALRARRRRSDEACRGRLVDRFVSEDGELFAHRRLLGRVSPRDGRRGAGRMLCGAVTGVNRHRRQVTDARHFDAQRGCTIPKGYRHGDAGWGPLFGGEVR